MNTPRIKCTLAALAWMAATAAAGNAQAAVTQNIDPAIIGLGEAAQLTIAASGSDASSITPPMVAGLEFVAVGQSQRIESINGTTRSTISVTYQVIPQRAGIFTIPGKTTGSPPVVLTVNTGNGGASATNSNSAAVTPQASRGGRSGAPAQVGPDGSAFVRLHLSKHDLYVGETIPVDIQVGTRDGMVASLNGQPTINGDAFTLDKLSTQPQRTTEVIDGNPFTVFTWHSALAAVKPGQLSLTMQTPLTVRIRTARSDSGFFGDSDSDDLFNDPALQGFFGTSTEKEVIIASSPASFNVQALPTAGRPATFNGAVGSFALSSGLSEDRVAVGDPITVHLRVSGSGNFDRVSSPMLHDVEHWKTYAPTSAFKPQDQIGYSGEKTFDQPVIATQPGPQSIPALTFSWFDPKTRHYVEAHTSPLLVAVAPANTSQSSTAANSTSQANPNADPNANPKPTAGAASTDRSGLQPDHAVTGKTVASLVPLYFETPYVVAPSILAFAFLSAGFWIRRRDRRADEMGAAREQEAALQTGPLLTQMQQAAGTSNAELFLKSALQAVQRALALRWHMPPSSVTIDEAKTRLGPDTDVIDLFELALEASYSKVTLTALDFKHWTRVVLQQINSEMRS